MGKRAWRTPIPHLVPVQPQGWAGTVCFPGRKLLKLQTCVDLVSQAGGATISRSELKSLTQNSEDPQNGSLSGPATRPMTPLAVENSVGKLAAALRRGAQCQHGKESMANSHPPFGPCPAARLGRDCLFSGEEVVEVADVC